MCDTAWMEPKVGVSASPPPRPLLSTTLLELVMQTTWGDADAVRQCWAVGSGRGAGDGDTCTTLGALLPLGQVSPYMLPTETDSMVVVVVAGGGSKYQTLETRT